MPVSKRTSRTALRTQSADHCAVATFTLIWVLVVIYIILHAKWESGWWWLDRVRQSENGEVFPMCPWGGGWPCKAGLSLSPLSLPSVQVPMPTGTKELERMSKTVHCTLTIQIEMSLQRVSGVAQKCTLQRLLHQFYCPLGPLIGIKLKKQQLCSDRKLIGRHRFLLRLYFGIHGYSVIIWAYRFIEKLNSNVMNMFVHIR